MALITKIRIVDVMHRTKSNSLKQSGDNIADLIFNTDPMNINKIVDLISLGNSSCEVDKAADILENYLEASPDNTLITAYLEIISKYEELFGIFKTAHLTIDDVKAQIEESGKAIKEQFDESLKHLVDKEHTDTVENKTDDNVQLT